jgi:hypothetical protein
MKGVHMHRATLFGFLLLAAGSGGCIDMYEATGTCTYCENGKKKVVPIATPTGTQFCTNENAELELDRTCQELNPDGVVTNVAVGKVSVLDVGQCGDDRQPANVVTQTGRALNPWLAALQPRPVAEVIIPLEEESCEVDNPANAFTVTVYNEYRPYNSCPDAKEMRIAYNRYLGEGLSEPVIRAIQVSFGGSHTFTVTDAAVLPQDAGKARVSVYAQLYDTSAFPDCGLRNDFLGAGYKLADNAELIIHEHPETGGFIPTINPAANSLALPAKSVTQELAPIPDPRFSSRQH